MVRPAARRAKGPRLGTKNLGPKDQVYTFSDAFSDLSFFSVVSSFKEFEYHTFSLSIIFATHVVFKKVFDKCTTVVHVYFPQYKYIGAG